MGGGAWARMGVVHGPAWAVHRVCMGLNGACMGLRGVTSPWCRCTAAEQLVHASMGHDVVNCITFWAIDPATQSVMHTTTRHTPSCRHLCFTRICLSFGHYSAEPWHPWGHLYYHGLDWHMQHLFTNCQRVIRLACIADLSYPSLECRHIAACTACFLSHPSAQDRCIKLPLYLVLPLALSRAHSFLLFLFLSRTLLCGAAAFGLESSRPT